MTASMMEFNEQLEHFAELTMVILIGLLISRFGVSWEGMAVALLLFLVIRPVAVFLSLTGSPLTRKQRGLIAWFGIRGIGSLYYLLFALQYPWIAIAASQRAEMTTQVTVMVLSVIGASIVLHGISATPLMIHYRASRQKRSE